MNWFKKAQNDVNELAIAIYSMLVDAADNPSKPIDVQQRLEVYDTEAIEKGFEAAYNRLFQDTQGYFSESQLALMNDINALLYGVNENVQQQQQYKNTEISDGVSGQEQTSDQLNEDQVLT